MNRNQMTHPQKESTHGRVILRFSICLYIAAVLFNLGSGLPSSTCFASGPTAGQELRAMGLIEGRGGGDLAEGAYLSRTEMMVVLSRMLGVFEQASIWNWTSGFADQSNHWGEPFVAYARYYGWTVGVGGGQFGYELSTTVQEASVFMLKSLGYTSPQDFTWETAFDKARSIGLFKDLNLNQSQPILRGSLFKLMMNTLEENVKGEVYTLGEKLKVLVGPSTADDIASARANRPMAAVRIGDKWGFISSDKKLAIRFLFDDARNFSEELAPVAINGKYGYIDKAGTMILNPVYEDAGSFIDGLAPVKINGKYGYIDQRGNFDIPATYDFADRFSEGLAIVALNGKVGFIDHWGTLVIPMQFDQANPFVNGVAAVKVKDLIGYVNPEGVYVIEPQYSIYGIAEDGLLRFNREDKTGFMNLQGEVVIPASFVWADHFSEGLSVVQSQTRDGNYQIFYINTRGDRAFSQNFQDAFQFSEGRAFVMVNEKFGVIDKTGLLIVRPNYTTPDLEGYRNGFARITEQNKVGYMDREGKIAITPQFDEGKSFAN